MKCKNQVLNFVSVIVILFGLITLKEGGSVALNIGTARVDAGNYVPFVVWFNFLSGFVYITAGIGLWFKKTWASKLSIFLLSSILAVYTLLFIHILGGGLYETRTVFAMGFRALIWGVTAFVSFKTLSCKKNPSIL